MVGSPNCAHAHGTLIELLCKRFGPEWPSKLRDALRARCKAHLLHRCAYCAEWQATRDVVKYHVAGWR